MVLPEIKEVSKQIRHLILFDHAATAKHFGAIQVFDPRGQLAIDAATLDPKPEDRADEEYFLVHRDRPDASEWRRAQRQRTPLSLLMIDADHFKAYNDAFGHQAGDQVLIGIAICISDSIKRAADCAARYGGEEFAVLLPGMSGDDALAVAETIRLKVQAWSDETTTSTVSIGIASMTPVAGLDWPPFVETADKALYAAKASGRNRSVLAPVPPLPLAA